MEATANLIDRWHMGLEARILVMLTAVLLAFGLATVYSASAIVAITVSPAPVTSATSSDPKIGT